MIPRRFVYGELGLSPLSDKFDVCSLGFKADNLKLLVSVSDDDHANKKSSSTQDTVSSPNTDSK